MVPPSAAKTADTARAIHQYALNHIFLAFIHDNAQLRLALQSYSGAVYIKDSALHFTLPALFDLTLQLYQQQHNSPCLKDTVTYIAFRRQVYRHNTNTLLRQYHAMIVIDEQGSRHDETCYVLKLHR